jgi:hypothetical protein
MEAKQHWQIPQLIVVWVGNIDVKISKYNWMETSNVKPMLGNGLNTCHITNNIIITPRIKP